jgi:hypothetical protein
MPLMPGSGYPREQQKSLVTSHREGRYKFHYIDTGPLERLTDRWRNRESKEN